LNWKNWGRSGSEKGLRQSIGTGAVAEFTMNNNHGILRTGSLCARTSHGTKLYSWPKLIFGPAPGRRFRKLAGRGEREALRRCSATESGDSKHQSKKKTRRLGEGKLGIVQSKVIKRRAPRKIPKNRKGPRSARRETIGEKCQKGRPKLKDKQK